MILIRENKELDRQEVAFMTGSGRARIEEAARLEGITVEDAVRRKAGFRYLI